MCENNFFTQWSHPAVIHDQYHNINCFILGMTEEYTVLFFFRLVYSPVIQ